MESLLPALPTHDVFYKNSSEGGMGKEEPMLLEQSFMQVHKRRWER